MLDIIESILKTLNDDFGISIKITKPIYWTVLLLLITFGIIKLFLIIYSKLKLFYIKKNNATDFHPYLTPVEIHNYTRFYIQQDYQNISPSDGEEPHSIYAAAARSKLMPLFFKKGGIYNSDIKYYLILSDTGMGKTAFLLNLYIKYKTKRKKLKEVSYDIKYIPLGYKNALEDIDKIVNKENTILLLDAFDEDIHAINNYKSRMDELLNHLSKFRKIILTCRTQFFSNKQEEPYETNEITFGDNLKLKFKKVYLSPFEEADIFKYLLKKFNVNIYKIYKSYKIVKKSPNLMIRPMLLSYIDDLINVKIKYKYSFEIYKVLIDKWIDREIKKPAIQNRNNAQYYREHLESFSRKLAVDLYEQRAKRDAYTISKDELKQLLDNSSLDLTLFTIEDHTSRSLLNRNSNGDLKFAHKSILEYLLAERLFSNSEFLKKFNFYGMDATFKFLNEMIHNSLLSVEGIFTLQNDTKTRLISSINIKEIDTINTLIIRNVKITKPIYFAGIRNCKEVYFIDDGYIFVYYVYLILNINKLIRENGTNDSNRNVFKSIKDKLEVFAVKISNRDRVVKNGYLLKIINQSSISDNIKNEFKYYLIDCQDKTLNNDDIQRLYTLSDLILNPKDIDNQNKTFDNLLGNKRTLPKKFGRIYIEDVRMATLDALIQLETIEKLSEINPKTAYYF